MFRIIILSFALMLIAINSHAQLVLPEPVLTKYENGILKIKWEPGSTAEWKQSLKSGYLVELTDEKGQIQSQLIKPVSFEELKKQTTLTSSFKSSFFEGVQKLLYPEKINDANDRIEKQFAGESPESIDTLRLGYIIYSGIYDFQLTQLSGLGASFKVSQGKQYTIKISTPGYDAKLKNVATVLSSPKAPEMKGTWGDREVEIEWKTFHTRKQYFGYLLERSTDGIRFNLKDSIPYVNIHDKSNSDPASVKSVFKLKDSLDFNDKIYYYRLKGLDYFGEVGSHFTMLVGQGYEKVTMSPFITFADQTEDNKAHIKWNIAPIEAKKVHHFEVFRTDSLGGKYERIIDSIGPTEREVYIPIKSNSNYYRIEAFASQGKGLSSNPILVMGQDTVPPLKPVIIGAYLDSLKRAVVSWKSNKESDLWGYRVFKSNFKGDEYTLLNSYPVLDTVFIDPVDLKLGTKDIFYLIEAADKRNNRSPLSDTIRIELPDLIPPSSPIVHSLVQEEDTVVVTISRSVDKDVVSHSLYRRDVLSEPGWQVIKEYGENDSIFIFKDVNAQAGIKYAYTVTAKDKAGNQSEPEHFQEILIKKKAKPFIAFEKIDKIIDEKNMTVTIQWQGSSEKELKSVLVYKGTDKEKLSKYKYVDSPQFSLTDALLAEEGKVMYYRLKPVYENQDRHYFSDYIEVVGKVKQAGK